GKAGVGSAVNDTTRELGGSLGVAVLGSLLSSGYRGGFGRGALSGASAGLPPPLVDAARESVGAALGIAGRVPEAAGDLLSSVARHAFTDAMGAVFLAAAAVALVSAGLVLRFMPGRSRSPAVTAPPVGGEEEPVPA
ncbi:MAG: MFS transporter, partial [Actinobacteria bacterium]|nr:MFS transporter [Actinomycetota bacterium]